MKMRPRDGKGERFLDCRYYNECLDVAGIQNWKGFDCEACDFYLIIHKGPDELIKAQMNMEKPKEKQLCKDCGEKECFGMSPYCASCMAIRSNKSEARKDKKTKKPKPLKGRKKDKPEKSPRRGEEAVLKINFGKYASILRQVERLADQELRPVESQVIYMLRNCLSGSGEMTQLSGD